MQYRELGQTDIQVPAVILGAWAIGGWMWGGTDERAAIEAIKAGIDAGMNCIDTAPTYGFGLSESIVGKAIAGRRDEVTIATKCGLRWDTDEGELFVENKDNQGRPVCIRSLLTKASLCHECELSLKRLNIDCIDLYQIHWPGKYEDFAEAMEAFDELKHQGKIRAVGVSNFSVTQNQNCLRYGRVDCNQPKYSLLTRRIETDLLPFCRENSIGVIAYSPMELGLLTGKVTMDRTFPDNDIRAGAHFPWYQLPNRKRVLDALESIKPIAAAHDITLAQLALAWVIAQPGVTAAIAGARNPTQALENAQAGDVQLAAAELKQLRDTFEALGEPA